VSTITRDTSQGIDWPALLVEATAIVEDRRALEQA
jgi:hypothetical protein